MNRFCHKKAVAEPAMGNIFAVDIVVLFSVMSHPEIYCGSTGDGHKLFNNNKLY